MKMAFFIFVLTGFSHAVTAEEVTTANDSGVEERIGDSEAARAIAAQRVREAEEAERETQILREQQKVILLEAALKKNAAKKIIAKAEAQIARLEAERNSLHAQIAVKQKAIAETQAQVAATQTRVDALVAETRVLRKLREEDQAAVAKLVQERIETAARERAGADQLRQAQSAFDDSLVTTKFDREQIENDIDLLKAKVAENRAKMEAIRRQGKSLQRSQKSLMTKTSETFTKASVNGGPQ